MPWPSTLPLPRLQGYSYTIPTVLKRTSFADGSRWQRPPPGGLRRQFTVSYDLDLAELQDLMFYIHWNGFGEDGAGDERWLEVPLVSGESTDGSAINHTVRVIADPKIQRLEGAEHFIVELQFEDQGPPSFVTWPLN